jgi:alpha-L-fucosidase
MTFDEIQSTPWECVRGMDQSFGYNAQSAPGDFLSRDELLWTVTDIAAKGGNLLLNVGPRGVDAQIPDEQLERLAWLAGFVPPNQRALVGTRPWSVPGSETVEGDPVRYTARGDHVYAFVGSPLPSATLDEVGSTQATAVTTIAGDPLGWSESGAGLRIDLPPSKTTDPTVVVLEHVLPRRH